MNNKTDFQMIPTAAQLESLNRQLAFIPSPTNSPTSLSREDIAKYNEQGFVKGMSVFDAEEIADIRNYFDDLLADAISAGKDSYSISTAHLKHGRVHDIICNPKIVSYVTDILGPSVVGWGSHFFCKMPHDGKQVAWHQDASYWPLDKSNTATVWLAIDDADQENACMQFIRGSHKFGHIPYRTSESGEGNVLDQTIDNVEQYGDVDLVELQAGQISIHSDLLLHGSDANNSDRRRCGLTLRYCTTDVKASLDWHLKGVLVAGEDADGNWGNATRPESD